MLDIMLNTVKISAVGEVILNRSRLDDPATVNLKFRKEDVKGIELGALVEIKYKENENSNSINAFKGYVFSIKETQDDLIELKAYDQLRYLKNATTVVVKNKTASQLLTQLCNEFSVNVGDIEDTVVDIAPDKQIIYENKSIFNIIYEALDITSISNKNKKKLIQFVLFDDYGKICLKDIENMNTSSKLINNDNLLSIDNSYSIDEDTFNRIMLTFKNNEKGVIEKFRKDNTNTQSKWGVLQKVISIDGVMQSSPEAYANNILNFYNIPKWKLSLETLATDINVRGGSKVTIALKLNDRELKKILIVDKVQHIFNNSEYKMKLELIGESEYGVS